MLFLATDRPSQSISWNDIDKAMEMSPEMWNPDLWRQNVQLKDEYDIPHVRRRSTGTRNKKRAAEDSGSQAEE